MVDACVAVRLVVHRGEAGRASALHEETPELLITERALRGSVSVLASGIAETCADHRTGLTIVAVLAGSIIFPGDLICRLPMKMRIGLVTVSNCPGRATVS